MHTMSTFFFLFLKLFNRSLLDTLYLILYPDIVHSCYKKRESVWVGVSDHVICDVYWYTDSVSVFLYYRATTFPSCESSYFLPFLLSSLIMWFVFSSSALSSVYDSESNKKQDYIIVVIYMNSLTISVNVYTHHQKICYFSLKKICDGSSQFLWEHQIQALCSMTTRWHSRIDYTLGPTCYW